MTAKYIVLLTMIVGTLFLSFIWDLVLYEIFVRKTEFANGQLWDGRVQVQMSYVGFLILGIGTAIAATFFGECSKTRFLALPFLILFGLLVYIPILWEKENV